MDCWGTGQSHKGTVEAFLTSCPSLSQTRMELDMYNTKFLQANPGLAPLVDLCLDMDRVQFLLDCSTMAPVISAVQREGEIVMFKLLKLSRNYCHGIYKARLSFLSD